MPQRGPETSGVNTEVCKIYLLSQSCIWLYFFPPTLFKNNLAPPEDREVPKINTGLDT